MPTEIIRERNAAAGAWAAAAVVLAVGALVFGFTAHVRANDLEAQLAQLRTREAMATVPVNGVDGSTGASGGSSGEGSGGTLSESESAARVAITRAFNTVYDGSRAVGDRVAAIDDPTGVPEALAALESGPNGALVRQVVVSVNDVRFTTPNAAAVTYTLTVPGMDPVGREGAAVFADGAWKVSRATICRDLVDVGSGC